MKLQQKNLDIYGSEPLEWARAVKQLEDTSGHRTCWLATTDPDGGAHIAGVGGLWVDDKLYFTSGPRARKSRNLAGNPRCALSVALGDLDLVVEGTASKVTDEATVAYLAERYAAQGWPARAEGRVITAEYSAPSAGPAPWDLYALVPETAYGVATAEPFGATRWRFGRDGR
jgi:nitroimidazol reductase NimA-like FMN-containing flavoprotein (pyridoxamine 5'-phosphate oxidase superfamily)